MPTYRSIKLSLVSQYDILTIPEYSPPDIPLDPFSTYPRLLDAEQAIVSTYMPTYPSSQFWLSYKIAGPHPPKALYYFKLYLNSNEVVSWGCGSEDEYQGKTMFTLSPAGQFMGKTVWERRVFAFGKEGMSRSKGAMDDVMEVRVFRSRGRRRIVPTTQVVPEVPVEKSAPRHTKAYKKQQIAQHGIELPNAGVLPRKHPQRYYQYALLDSLDKPFATFRYYFRSMQELYALGAITQTPSDSDTSRSSTEEGEEVQQTMAPHSAAGSLNLDMLDAATLESPLDSPGIKSTSSSPTSQYSAQIRHDFSSPLSKISEEMSSIYSSPGGTLDLKGTWSKHNRTPSSPLRLPRLTRELPCVPGNTGSAMDMNVRPPTPPLRSPPRSQLDVSTPKDSTKSSSPKQKSRSLRSMGSKESFTKLIREGISSANLSSTESGDSDEDLEYSKPLLARIAVMSNVSRTASVGALRKVFEKGTGLRKDEPPKPARS